MAKYFFHTEDGQIFPDETGTELPDMAAVRRTALLTMAEMSQTLSDEFWREKALRITVTDDRGLTLMSLDLMATMAAALPKVS